MADPVIRKLTERPEVTTLLGTHLMEIVTPEDTDLSSRNKKLKVSNFKLFNAAQIGDGIVSQSKLAANAVSTAKIVDANVTNAKLASNAVTTAKIADGQVTEAKLAANAVTNSKIADAQITRAKLAIMDKPVAVPVTAMGDLVIANSCSYLPIPAAYAGYKIVGAWICVDSKSSSPITVNIKSGNTSDGFASIANVTLAANTANSSVVAINKTLASGEHIAFNVTSAAGDGKGLIVVLNIQG